MDSLFPFLTPLTLACAMAVAFCAGFVKGVVGFAMPLVMISGLTLFLSPELALAGLILPTLVGNLFQAMRQGTQAAVRSTREFKHFLVAGGITLLAAAQMVRIVPDAVLFFIIGVPTLAYAALQLGGVRFRLAARSRMLETAVGALAGVMGGISGVWGPPTVMYLTALDTPKHDQMRVQGVIYGMGSVALVIAHLGSGVLRGATLPFSALLILPGLAGMWVGGKVIDRIDQAMFRRATLCVLLIAGLNLIRRSLF